MSWAGVADRHWLDLQPVQPIFFLKNPHACNLPAFSHQLPWEALFNGNTPLVTWAGVTARHQLDLVPGQPAIFCGQSLLPSPPTCLGVLGPGKITCHFANKCFNQDTSSLFLGDRALGFGGGVRQDLFGVWCPSTPRGSFTRGHEMTTHNELTK